MPNLDKYRVKQSQLRWTCDPNQLGFETTDDFECKPHIIGQDRALDAIRLGLEMKSPGYNIYISGLTGTGKKAAVRRVLSTMDLKANDLQDICYVTNFKVVDRPVCIAMPAGKGSAFKRRMGEVLVTIREFIPAVHASERFKAQQAKVLAKINKRKDKATQSFEKEVQDKGFSLVEVDDGRYTRPVVAPVVGGEVVGMDQLPALLVQGKVGRGDYDKMRKNYPELMEQLDEILQTTGDLQKELGRRMVDLEREHIQPLVAYALGEVKEAFDIHKVDGFLSGLEDFVMGNLRLFHNTDSGEDVQSDGKELLPFRVNVVVDNAGATEVPVVVEPSPSYANLFGTIERQLDRRGDANVDFMGIRAGAMLNANGGYLVVNLADLFEEPYVWTTFKRALKNKKQTIRSFDSVLLAPMTSLKPEEATLDLKVILIGDGESYQILYEYDEDFSRIFKVKSEFDSVMPNRKSNLNKYCRFIKNLCEAEDLLPFHKSGAAAVIEEGSRLAGRQDRVSTQFSDVGDVIREASYWAKKSKSKTVRAVHVDRAIEQRTRRGSLYEDRLQEMFTEGIIIIDTKGSKVGQVNGLAVYDLGDHSFGKPSRITAETGVGRAGVVNIERESDMSGRIHNKGMLILEGYMRRIYAQNKPIAMTASICFEQAYSGIDGDSASSTEIYALVSSLSDVPMRQDIAVTGSVSQKGEIQPIGGVNQKIEGFFDVCRYKGLTGEQGVMIPAINKKDLMLRKDVVAAIAAGRFHIYAVKSIDEGIEVLAGEKAGRRLKSGRFTNGSVHDRVDDTLRRFHDHLRTAEEGNDEASDQ